MDNIKLITAPAVEPISLAEAKLQCRVDGSDEDSLITAYIIAARRMAEQKTGRSLCTQTWELALDTFEDEIVLPMCPVQSITSVKYIDTSGVEQTLINTTYELDNYATIGHYLRLAYGKSWPGVREQADAIKIRYVAGYGVAADVPADIKAWLLLAIGTMYANRESISMSQGALVELPGAFWHSLLDPYLTY